MKHNEYILTCPFCGLQHLIDIGKETVLLNDVRKGFSLQCADTFSDRGCKNTIIILEGKTMSEIQNKK